MFRQPKVAATLVAALMVVFRVDGMSGERRAAQPRACSPHEIIAHVAALSDDSMMGRAPGSEGDRAARRYIIKTLERYGIRPGAWRGFEQRVPLYRVREGTSELRINTAAGTAQLPATAGVMQSTLRDSLAVVSGELVWVGFGVDAPELGWSDYAGADVRGKIVVALSGAPAGLRARVPYEGSTFYETRAHKEWAAQDRGARGLILLADSATVHGERRRGWSYFSDATSRRPAITVTADSSVFLPLLGVSADARTGARPTSALALTAQIDATLRQVVEAAPSANIVGMVPGRSDRWIAVTAHHDGLGYGPTDARGDSIYNGAQDNALGVAMALCVARGADPRAEVGLLVYRNESSVTYFHSMRPSEEAERVRTVAAISRGRHA